MRLIDADALKTELEKLRDGWNYYGGEYESAMYQAYDISVDTVDEQPTVQPRRKKGKWIDDEGNTVTDKYCAICSACGEWSEYLTAYCPNCGAEMTEGEG